ncbi:MAG: aminoacetone oxidase family FAD-binding enzyme [Mogibacterium sp.]|nr:aminoacetone oxidase family FAD-binding enzyme [Mogibacterium sp.]
MKSTPIQTYDCIIIGAGASGLLAASLAETPPGWRGLILEATGQPGTKLLMSGGGRCNFTHAGSIKDFPAHYGEQGRKIRALLYRYNNEEYAEFLRRHGIDTVTEDDGRMFPASGRASDIRDLLLSMAGQNQFRILTESRVAGILPEGASEQNNTSVYTVRTADGRAFRTCRLIIATGGITYPKTGSDGSMFGVLERDLGLSVTPLRPSLQPIRVRDYPYGDLAGISLPDCAMTLETLAQATGTTGSSGRRKPSRTRGAILLTHRDLSGPAILNLSRYLDADTPQRLVLNWLPGRERAELQRMLQNGLRNSRAEAATVVSERFGLPKRVCRKLADRARGDSGDVSMRKLAELLTEDRFDVLPYEDRNGAMVTAGGIPLTEVDLKTLECLRWSGLYIIGEALDVDGETGGYNLQWAYSSAAAAAEHMFAF